MKRMESSNINVKEVTSAITGKVSDIAVEYDHGVVTICFVIDGELYAIERLPKRLPVQIVELVASVFMMSVIEGLDFDSLDEFTKSDITIERLESGKIQISRKLIKSFVI